MLTVLYTIMAGLALGGFLAVFVCCKETYDEELVCWDGQK